MSLILDQRQQAMLREMKVRYLQAPQRVVAASTVQGPVAPMPELASMPVNFVTAAPQSPLRSTGATGIELMEWDALAATVAECRACALCNGRRNTVFGVGDRRADWLIVGEAPGEIDDLQGEPFLGQEGLLLDNMLRALGLNRRQKVYVANVLKCRPPGNRNPEPQELAQCEPFLRRQVELLQPRVILAMGRFAVQAMLRSTEPIGKLRGQVHRYNGVPLVVTYHPSSLLLNLADKGKAWADLCLALEVLEQPTVSSR